MDSQLTPLQHDLLEAFFARSDEFYLTGGAALVGFHLHHRSTKDLDLVAGSKILNRGDIVLTEAADSLGAKVERPEAFETFRRRIVRRGNEAVVVDLVVDTTHQGTREKPRIGRIRVDPPEEILANKLCTLVSRSEIRDLIDVYYLIKTGLPLQDALELAHKKDGGVVPASLAWVLSQIRIGDDARLPGSVSPSDMRAFIADLEERMSRLAFPGHAS